jgi:peptide/nickel transport system substrate-binding protein
MKIRISGTLAAVLTVSISIVILLTAACSAKLVNTGSPAQSASALSAQPAGGSTTPEHTGSTSPTPKSGGILKFGTISQAGGFGWPVNFMSQGIVNQFCMETLLRGDNQGKLYPWLADSFKVADDLKSITFSLRKGVLYHDGSGFNAETAKWSLDMYIQAKSEPLWESVDIIDDYTVRVNFNSWNNTLPASFADSSLQVFMLSKLAYDKNGKSWMTNNPVGTGPFKFVSYQQDVSLKFVKNPEYWIKGKPRLDGIELLFANDELTRKAMMQTREIDMVEENLGKKTAEYSQSGFKVRSSVTSVGCLVPDTADPDSPWANQKVREAAEYAIDREAIAKAFGYGYWKATYQVPPRSTAAYNPDFTLGRQYNLEKARTLLSDAGYPEGFATTIIAFPVSDRDMVSAIQSNLAQAGIRAQIEYPQTSKWMTYMGSNKWSKNAVLFMALPGINSTYNEGLQFIFNIIGQSWARPPSLTQLYQTAMESAEVDTGKIRAVTDTFTREALIIPIHEGGSSRVEYIDVNTDFQTRGSPLAWNAEDASLDK